MSETAYLAWVLFGIAGGSLGIWFARRVAAEAIIFGGALLIAALWYVAFGIVAGTGVSVLAPQLVGGALFAALGVAAIRYSIAFAGIGWLIHIVWDVTSPVFSDVSYMPAWTVPACLGFDLLVGTYLLARHRGRWPLAQAA